MEELHRQAPDVLLLGGDFVTCRGSQIDGLLQILRGFTPALGQFSVLGNHDRLADEAYIRRQLHAADIPVFMNAAAHLPAPFDSVSVCGIDDPWTGEPDVAKAFKDAGPFSQPCRSQAEGSISARAYSVFCGNRSSG